MRILITGAAGFIGSHICEKATAKGFSIRAFIRPTSNRRFLLSLPVSFHYGDLTEKESILPALNEIDYIIHCAGVVKGKGKDYEKINLIGTKNLLAALKERRVPLKKFIYISTVAASGPSLNGQPKKETFECQPISEYGRTKLLAERLLLEYAANMNLLILRPGAIYGPRDREFLTFFRLLKKGIAPIFGGVFSIMYVEDLAEATLLLLQKDTASGEIFFLADGKRYTAADIARTFEEITGIKNRKIRIPYHLLYLYALFQEVFARHPVLVRNRLKELTARCILCDTTKLEAIGFVPQHDLYSGMKKTIEWYEKEGWL